MISRVNRLDDLVSDLVVDAERLDQPTRHDLLGSDRRRVSDAEQIRNEPALRRAALDEHRHVRGKPKLPHQRLLDADLVPRVLIQGAQHIRCVGAARASRHPLLGEHRKDGEHAEDEEQTG